jgi:hypothetical protein
MANPNEQIVALTQKRIATADRMKVLMDGGLGDETQQKEYDELVTTLDQTDVNLTRLEAFERSQVGTQALQGVTGSTQKTATLSRGELSENGHSGRHDVGDRIGITAVRMGR